MNPLTLNGVTFTGKAAKAIREWSLAKSNEIAELERGGWISVEDELPKVGGQYLVSAHGKSQFIALFTYGRWMRQTGSKRLDGITHWQPLPPPPKHK